ncbi:hypothetical protein F4808DRAFT_439138 [Astrocystis sublimbata]|nr:hypothetical protein F4808DRAFT_439138 [Astrocystis sublimbata]
MGAFISSVPLSPWAKRFSSESTGSSSRVTWDKSLHSQLAPELPRFDDPMYYADMHGKIPVRIPPSDEEVDRMFRTEALQLLTHLGITTWEAAILNRWVRYSSRLGHMSAGHLTGDKGKSAKYLNDAFELETLKVDEGKWEPWLRRKNWFNWVQTVTPQGGKPRNWSVDEDQVWSQV